MIVEMTAISGTIKLPRRTEYRGALFSKAAAFSQLYIVSKVPFMCGLTSSAVRLGNGSTHGGHFAMEKNCEICGKPFATKPSQFNRRLVQAGLIERDPVVARGIRIVEVGNER